MANTIHNRAVQTPLQQGTQSGGFFRKVRAALRDVLGTPQAPIQKQRRMDYYAASTSYTESSARNLNAMSRKGNQSTNLRTQFDPQIHTFLNDIIKNDGRI